MSWILGTAVVLDGMLVCEAGDLDYKNQVLCRCQCAVPDCELLCTLEVFHEHSRPGESKVAYAFDNVSNGLIGNKSLLHKGLAASIHVKS